jgi:hypothetical protein
MFSPILRVVRTMAIRGVNSSPVSLVSFPAMTIILERANVGACMKACLLCIVRRESPFRV